MTLFYRFGRRVCIVVCRTLFRLRVWDIGNVPLAGGAILVANHQCYLDPPFGACLIRRQCSFLARSSLFGFAPFRWLIARLGAVPLGRGEPDAAALRRAVALLRSGELLMLFPEGTRTRDGALGRMQSGAAALALRAGVPVVPAFIHGAFDCWPRTRRLPRPGRVDVFYGRPLPPPAGAGAGAGGRREAVRELTAKIQSALEELQRRAFQTMPLKHRSAPPTACAGTGQDGPVPGDPPASAQDSERAARPALQEGHRPESGTSGAGSSRTAPGALRNG